MYPVNIIRISMSGSMYRSAERLCTALTVFSILVRRGERHGSPRIKGCIRQHSCSFHVQNLFLARLRLGFSGGGRSLNVMEQNSFFDNDIKGDGCFCVWSGACLKCSEDSGVVGQVHCCCALGMIISCYRRESLKQLSAWHVNNDLPFSPADA